MLRPSNPGATSEHGVCWQGLWKGTVPGQLLAVPYTAVQFVALQQCRSFAHRNGLLTGDRAWLLSFLSGAAAGTAATIASYPFDTLRTILAAQGKPPVRPCSNLLNYLISLLRAYLLHLMLGSCTFTRMPSDISASHPLPVGGNMLVHHASI